MNKKKSMEKDKMSPLGRDLGKALMISTAIAAALSLVVAAGTWLAVGLDSHRMMENARNALFIPGSLGLFLAVLFFVQRKGQEELKHEQEWNAIFARLRPVSVLLLISTGLLIYGVFWDYALFYS